MAEVENCPNCGASLKEGMFSNNYAVGPRTLKAINLALGEAREAACTKCYDRAATKDQLYLKETQLRTKVVEEAAIVPLASVQLPDRWRYRTLGLVTAQSVTGTGMWSDVTSAFTDLFGAQSKVYNSKIRHGEDLCKLSLRLQALKMGVNAVVGVDVDYAEVGGQRAMLMVCMTGTAVYLENSAEIFSYIGAAVERLNEDQKLLEELTDVRSALA